MDGRSHRGRKKSWKYQMESCGKRPRLLLEIVLAGQAYTGL